MNWLTSQLTGIEKVRRNVMLFAAFSILLALFPIGTSHVSIFGAPFSSDVIVFGLFYGLSFYTISMMARAWLHFQANPLEDALFAASVERELADVRAKAFELRENAIKQRRAQLERVQDRIRLFATDARKAEEQLQRFRELSALTDRPLSFDETAVDREKWVRSVEVGITTQQAALERNRERLNEAVKAKGSLDALPEIDPESEAAARQLDLRAAGLSSRSTVVERTNLFIFAGEYALPIVGGLVGCALLLLTHDFPMPWEIQIPIPKSSKPGL